MISSQLDQWQNLESTINAWLKERQELIVLYCALCGVNELAGTPDEQKVLDRLKRFCQILVDYLSAGHFEIFAEIFAEAESKDKAALIQDTYPKLEASTPPLLDFNDIYDNGAHSKKALAALPKQLSLIGEILTQRFDLEDRLITLHQSIH